ncbi:MAG: SDR family NAD(P)-dependent oxidoreductase, partial [Chitinophagaceae bacterium]|nr:SDR family NAD(P)-dependent oxidoreductase [Chitinophagaceae bacterium]
QAALPLLKQSKGSILFISSIAAIHGLGNYAAYSCSKMALTAFTQSLKKELTGTNVHTAIAYVSFTENDETKTVLNSTGSLVPQPKRKNITVTAQSTVAAQLIKMIETRKVSVVFSGIGKLLNTLNRLSPFLVHKILSVLYQKEMKAD